MKNKKLAMITTLSVLVLSMIGFTYAMWSETLTISGSVATGELDWEFVLGSHTQKDPHDPITNDWNKDPTTGAIYQMDKNVGWSEVVFVDTDGDLDYDKMVVTFGNVYPGYYEHIAFKLHCNGDIPLRIWKIIINGQDYYAIPGAVDLDLGGNTLNDITIWYGNNFGLQMHNCDEVNISFDLLVLQGAPQGETLSFTIEIVAVQYNEYVIP